MEISSLTGSRRELFTAEMYLKNTVRQARFVCFIVSTDIDISNLFWMSFTSLSINISVHALLQMEIVQIYFPFIL